MELSIEAVPYPLTIPKYEVCPSENLTFYHRFPFHTGADPRLLRATILPTPSRRISLNDYDAYAYNPNPSLYDMNHLLRHLSSRIMIIMIGYTATNSANYDIICILSTVPSCLPILYSILNIYQS